MNKENLKIIVVGKCQVGKSCLIRAITSSEFDQAYSPTVGVSFIAKNIIFENQTVRIQLWDTAGQEVYRALTYSYFRDADCALIVYDIADEGSFKELQDWVDDVKAHTSKECVSFIVGNKIDLDSDRKISFQQGLDFAKENKLQFFEVSAKTGDGLNLLLDSCVSAIFQNKISNPPKPEVQERSGCRC